MSALGWIGWSLGVVVLGLGAPVVARIWRGEPTRLDRSQPYITPTDPEWTGWLRGMPSAWFAGVWLLLGLALLSPPIDGGAAAGALRAGGLACAALALGFGVLSLMARVLGYPRWVIAPHLRAR